MVLFSALLTLACLTGALATPFLPDLVNGETRITAQNTLNKDPMACAPVAKLVAKHKARDSSARVFIPANVAINCLRSVPNKPEQAEKLIRSVKAFTQWQSTLAWLKDPPADYPFPPVDILKGLDDIMVSVKAGVYGNEYDFQYTLIQLFISAHDGHLGFLPDIFKAFAFRNEEAEDIVSVSTDGVAFPKLYHYPDLEAKTGNKTPAAIVKINGEDSWTWTDRVNRQFNPYTDPDAQWNVGFRNYVSTGSIPFFAAYFGYPGPNLRLQYDNGTSRVFITKALVMSEANFTGVNSGEDFYNRFCSIIPATDSSTNSSDSNNSSDSTSKTRPSPTIPGYPYPVVRDNGQDLTSGYFLNGTGYDDVAVLAVSGFEPDDGAYANEYLRDYQSVVKQFLAESKKANKKKLVIDLVSNRGGYFVAVYDLLAQLFPDQRPLQAQDMRATEALLQIGGVVKANIDKILAFTDTSNPPQKTGNATLDNYNEAIFGLWNNPIAGTITPGCAYRPIGAKFKTIDELIAIVKLKGDRFTAYQNTPFNETGPYFNLTGTGNQANPPPAVFKPEDVVLLTDATCDSACANFVSLMVHQLNISATVVGGRPKPGPVQTLGGVKGSLIFTWDDISAAATLALSLDSSLNKTGSDLQVLDEGYANLRSSGAFSSGHLNGMNFFSMANAEVPLQFVYQAANCRIFYNKDMILGPEQTWKRVVDATWTDPAKYCAEGSRMPSTYPIGKLDPAYKTAGK